jgi:hypothetical protein
MTIAKRRCATACRFITHDVNAPKYVRIKGTGKVEEIRGRILAALDSSLPF